MNAPARISWGPYLLILAGAATGLALVGFGARPYMGGVVIGVFLLLAAGLRFLLSGRGSGPLVVRSRRTDALTYLGFGVLMITASLLFLVDLHQP